LDEFFARYPDFRYLRNESFVTEYWRLRRHQAWGRDSDEGDEAKKLYQDALTKAFNALFGTDVNSIESWRALCNTIGIEPSDTLRKCREAVEKEYVNLVDLVDLAIRDTGEKPERFESEEQLSAYTRQAGKYFPGENAYAGGLLRYLLRHIMHPNSSARESRRQRGRGGGR
ncbi:hypothetical protein BD779DRAFT_1419816, partial [Infundibulicybe gibba]